MIEQSENGAGGTMTPEQSDGIHSPTFLTLVVGDFMARGQDLPVHRHQRDGGAAECGF